MADNSMTGRVVVVTGVSSGIGQAIAIDLAVQSAHVVATARSSQRLTAIVASVTDVRGSGQAIPCDVTSGFDARSIRLSRPTHS